MREQGAIVVLPARAERKKTILDVSNDHSSRRLGAVPLSHFGGKPITHMPVERLPGGSTVIHRPHQEAKNNDVPRSVTEKMKENGKIEIENGRMERKSAEHDVMLLHWGHRKRPRCNRADLKHVTEESSELTTKKMAIRRAETGIQGQFLTKNVHVSDACVPAHLTNSNCHAAIRADGHSPSSPEKQDTVSTRPQTTLQNRCPEAALFVAEKLYPDLLQWPKILLSLSRKEKEDDFQSIKGTKLPQRPKRRPKVVEKALLCCSPGSWLTDLTRGRYDVRERKRMKKRPRGLKAMESMDSDTD